MGHVIVALICDVQGDNLVSASTWLLEECSEESTLGKCES